MNQATLDLKSLKDTYERRLFFFAFKRLKDKEQALDAVGDVFIRLWKNPNLLEKVINTEQYLYTAVRNACFEVLKKQSRSDSVVDATTLEALSAEWEKKEELYIIYTELIADLVGEWIQELPSPHRAIIERLYYDNEKIMDICASLNLSRYQLNIYKEQAIDQMKIKAQRAGRLKALLLLTLLHLLHP